MRVKTLSVLLFGLLSFSVAAEDDVLLLNAIMKEPPNTLEGLPRPKKGMTMERVKQVFGEPEKTTTPVGNPPISQWVYSGYVVYFEGTHVVNTVMKKPNVE